MNFDMVASVLKRAALAFAAVGLAGATPAFAQSEPAAPVTVETTAPDATAVVNDAAAPTEGEAAAAAGSYTPMGQDMFKGLPTADGWNVQPQYSDVGRTANRLHVGLIWMMIAISAFVLGLLAYVVIRFNKRAHPVPSKTTHNTTIEVIWTVVPVLILLVIAVPSISLLAKQYETAPEEAITIKAIGYQWYWGYEYPDNGGFEVVSNMLEERGTVEPGKRFRTDDDGPGLLAVDNRMVVPAGVPLRIQTTGADVIHSFAVPSLWFKLDAIPGRINEKMLIIDEPGVYFGQCSELCGIKHAYMPIAIEALPRAQWEEWVRTQPGGTVGGDQTALEDAELEDAANAPGVEPTTAPTIAPTFAPTS